MHDAKDWTWVLERQCAECGYEADRLSREQLGPRLRSVGGAWREMLGQGEVVEREPHGERRWSILEYGAHVRDVCELLEDRLSLILKKRKPPKFKDWNQEKAADKWGDLEANKVAYTLAFKAGKAADLVDKVRDDEWAKTGTRSDGVEFTAESLVRYMLHDIEHHLWDANQILESAEGDPD